MLFMRWPSKLGKLDRSEPLKGPSSAETIGTQDVLERLIIIMAAVMVRTLLHGRSEIIEARSFKGTAQGLSLIHI